MYTLFLQRVGRESRCLTIAIDKFALRDTSACYNSPLKTKVYLNRKVDGRCTRPVVFNLFCTATYYSNPLQPNEPHLRLQQNKCNAGVYINICSQPLLKVVHDPQRVATPGWKPLLDEVLILCVSSMQWSYLVFMVEESTKQLERWEKHRMYFF